MSLWLTISTLKKREHFLRFLVNCRLKSCLGGNKVLGGLIQILSFWIYTAVSIYTVCLTVFYMFALLKSVCANDNAMPIFSIPVSFYFQGEK